MLQVEFKKILFHHKGLLLLLIALAAYAVFCIGSGYDSSYVIDRNEDTYLAYMERWQGEITGEKAQEMEAEYAEATRSDDGRKAAFLTIYNQYYYAKEDPAHRFLMDERGWDTLLTHDGVNVILLLFLLALCVPVFCGEYQCGMAQILRSCRNGRWRLAGIKLGSMATLALFAAALFQLVQFVVVALSVGLDGASYPLHSLSFFESSPYLISIGQAYGIVVLSRCLGAAWFAILIALLSILFRQTVRTTFSGIAISILPHLIGGSFLKYVLPLPAGLLAGTGYVWGTLTEIGYDEDWNLIDIVTFPGITPEQFDFLMVLFLAIICLLIWLCLRFYVGRRKAISARPLLTVVLILCMTVSLTGCGQSNSGEITHDFLTDASKGENSAYTVELDMVKNTITATSKATGETILLTRGPFGQFGAISSIYVGEDACYYASNGEAGDGFQIYRIDFKNFSTRLFFSTGSDNTATFWGLLDHEPTVDELLADVGSITSFVVNGNYIYYLLGGRLYKVFRWTGYETVIVSSTEKMQSLEYVQFGKKESDTHFISGLCPIQTILI